MQNTTKGKEKEGIALTAQNELGKGLKNDTATVEPGVASGSNSGPPTTSNSTFNFNTYILVLISIARILGALFSLVPYGYLLATGGQLHSSVTSRVFCRANIEVCLDRIEAQVRELREALNGSPLTDDDPLQPPTSSPWVPFLRALLSGHLSTSTTLEPTQYDRFYANGSALRVPYPGSVNLDPSVANLMPKPDLEEDGPPPPPNSPIRDGTFATPQLASGLVAPSSDQQIDRVPPFFSRLRPAFSSFFRSETLPPVDPRAHELFPVTTPPPPEATYFDPHWRRFTRAPSASGSNEELNSSSSVSSDSSGSSAYTTSSTLLDYDNDPEDHTVVASYRLTYLG